MSGHTPGPWVARGLLICDASANIIAEVYVETGKLTQAHADARVGAVAPELLAACREAADLVRNHAGFHGDAETISEFGAVLARLNDAIAKATQV